MQQVVSLWAFQKSVGVAELKRLKAINRPHGGGELAILRRSPVSEDRPAAPSTR